MIDQVYGITPGVLQTIGEFTVNWNLFEKYYCGKDASAWKIKCLRLERFVDLPQRLKQLKEQVREHFVDRHYPVDLEHVKRVFFTRSGDRVDEDAELIRQFLTDESDNLNAGFLLIQRIRNNMLHGVKGAFDLPHQRELIAAASNVLYCLTKWDIVQDMPY